MLPVERKVDSVASLRIAFVVGVLSSAALASSCVLNMTRYTDGPITEYLDQPLPELAAPIARTFSVEKVFYNTAANQKGTMIGDLVAREIYILPAKVGLEVGALLQMDQEFSEEATLAALNVIAQRRSEARKAGSMSRAPAASGSSGSTSATIARHEQNASEAYAKGDYLGGDIHSTAAQTSIQIQASGQQTMAVANTIFSVLGAAAAAGEAMIKSEFNACRNWFQTESGAIGSAAPEGSHLSVFFLSYFDAKSFQFDSRMRAAVYLVLTEQNGNSTAILEGSDILNCESDCDLFQPKPTAKVFNQLALANEAQRILATTEGLASARAKGFDTPVGPYQYVLLKHGLAKLVDP